MEKHLVESQEETVEIVPLSPELLDQALTAFQDLYLCLESQNKIEVDMLALALIHTVLVSAKASYPLPSPIPEPKHTRARSRAVKDKPSDITRPTE